MLDPTEFGKAMAAIVKEAIAPLEREIAELKARQPERGEKGDAGEPGRDAEPVAVPDVVDELVKTGAIKTLIDLQVAESLAEHLKSNPPRDGKDGEPGPQGERGEKGEPGRDGLDVKDLFRADGGRLVAVLSDGTTKDLGVFVGKDGEPGKDGKDGADFSDAAIDFDGERTVTIRGKGGEIVKRLAVPMDAGFWREGMACEKGDIVTHDGNGWIAQRETKAKPCLENKDDWRLLVRKGRDGRDGKDGKAPPGPVKLKGDDDA